MKNFCHTFHKRVLLLACGLGLLVAGTAQANVNCTASMTNVMFGSVDLVDNTGASSSGMLTYTCTNDDRNNAVQVNACFLIDGGQGHQSQLNPSYMVDSSNAANQLLFNLYWPNGSTVWTTVGYGTSTPYNPPVFTIGKAPSRSSTSSFSGSATMPARLLPNQNVAPSLGANSYQNSYASGSTSIAWTFSNAGQAPPATCGANQPIRFPFNVNATVLKSCLVTANTLDFGASTGSLTSNIDSTTTVQATCSTTTPYQIGLDNGQNASGTTRRMTGASSEFVVYELYRNPGRSQRWGNTPPTDTVSGTGTGSAQTPMTVYGRVPPQTTPSSGDYRDTITVNINY